jgi:hypothetical protein
LPSIRVCALGHAHVGIGEIVERCLEFDGIHISIDFGPAGLTAALIIALDERCDRLRE